MNAKLTSKSEKSRTLLHHHSEVKPKSDGGEVGKAESGTDSVVLGAKVPQRT